MTKDSSDVYIIKLDSSGIIKWTKTIGGKGDDIGNSIIESKNGNLIITGSTNSYGAGG